MAEHGGRSRCGIEPSVLHRVLGIYRYAPDSSFPDAAKRPSERDAFDIVISDGSHKEKCLLHQSLNKHVYRGEIQRDTIVRITESAFTNAFVILIGLVIVESTGGGNLFTGAVDFEERVPLGSIRDSYLPLLNDEDNYGSIWDSKPDLKLRQRFDTIITLADLEAFWRTSSERYPLVARIVEKSRLYHVGKPSDVGVTLPYEAYLEIRDRSASATVCLSGASCVRLFKSLHVGDCIVVSEYGVSPMTVKSSGVAGSNSQSAQIEITVDGHSGKVHKLEPTDLSPLWRIPAVSYRFVQRADFPKYQSGLICDITGVVIFISSEIREKKLGSHGYWMYRWIHLHDGTSSSPIILKIFACSQPEVLEAITFGQVLVCTNMMLKVCNQNSGSSEHCFMHLTTTPQSQINILHHAKDSKGKPFGCCKEVREAIQWRMSPGVQQQIVDNSCIGGFYSFPPLPATFEDFPIASPVDLREVSSILNEVYYLEHIRLTLYGTVVAIEYIPFPDSGAEAVQESSNASSTAFKSAEQTTQEDCNVSQLTSVEGGSSDDQFFAMAPRVRAKTSSGGSTTEQQLNTYRLPISGQANSHEAFASGRHNPFPYKVLDHDWWKQADKIPVLGNVRVTGAIPVSFSWSYAGTPTLPDAQHETFCCVSGYWQLVIMDMHHPLCTSIPFLPVFSKHTNNVKSGLSKSKMSKPRRRNEKDSLAQVSKVGQSKTGGPFVCMLANGIIPSSYSVGELSDIAVEDLTDQQFLFVLDVLSHGQSEHDVIINRGYKM